MGTHVTRDNAEAVRGFGGHMTFFEFINQETAGSRPDLFFVAGLASLANAGLLALTNSAMREASADT
jgi:hypothetical protein